MGATRTLVLIHTNDKHSHLLGFGPELDDYPAATTAGSGAIHGGVGRIAAIFAQERDKAKAAGADSLTVGAGDVMQGTLTQVADRSKGVDFTVMKKLGYDVSTLGNHEFDYGPAGLATILTAAAANGGVVPTVASNIHFSATDSADDSLQALFDESGTDVSKPLHRSLRGDHSERAQGRLRRHPRRRRRQERALQGAGHLLARPRRQATRTTRRSTPQLYKDIQPVVDHLRNDEKVDLVIALSHSGIDTRTTTKGEDDHIAAQRDRHRRHGERATPTRSIRQGHHEPDGRKTGWCSRRGSTASSRQDDHQRRADGDGLVRHGQQRRSSRSTDQTVSDPSYNAHHRHHHERRRGGHPAVGQVVPRPDAVGDHRHVDRRRHQQGGRPLLLPARQDRLRPAGLRHRSSTKRIRPRCCSADAMLAAASQFDTGDRQDRLSPFRPRAWCAPTSRRARPARSPSRDVFRVLCRSGQSPVTARSAIRWCASASIPRGGGGDGRPAEYRRCSYGDTGRRHYMSPRGSSTSSTPPPRAQLGQRSGRVLPGRSEQGRITKITLPASLDARRRRQGLSTRYVGRSPRAASVRASTPIGGSTTTWWPPATTWPVRQLQGRDCARSAETASSGTSDDQAPERDHFQARRTAREVKDWEALAEYITPGPPNGGTLPARYNQPHSAPRRRSARVRSA